MNMSDWPLWEEAEREEIQGLSDKQVFVRTTRGQVPHGCQILPMTMQYKRKSCGRRKVRACVRGDMQRPIPSGNDTYAPTPPQEAVRYIFSHAVQNNRNLEKLDAVQAFTQANKLETPIYVMPPKGAEADSDTIWKLIRPLYGLGIAPKQWSDTLIEFLTIQGWTPVCRGEDTIYTKTVNGHAMFLLFWVDDILLSFDDASRRDIQLFKTAFMTRFDATDEGPVTQFLGIDVDYDREGGTLKISQQTTIDALLYECNMSNCNSASIPLSAGQILLTQDRDPNQDPRITKDYQSRVGTLLWLVASTRPDMAFAVHQLSKHLIAPGPKHIQALTHALRYLKGTSKMGITYTRSTKDADILIAAADADWATDPETRKSISGQIIMMNGGALYWSCRRQGGIAGSTTEAE